MMKSRETLKNPKDLVLMLTSANGGSIEGRTVLQKLCYFSQERLRLDLDFRPHYYGPFSAEIEDSTDILVRQELLDETIQRLPIVNPDSGFEARKYHYELTEEGTKYLERYELRSHSAYKTVAELITSIKKLGGFNPRVLSAAAKIDYIVSAEGKALSAENISEKAADIGWKLSGEEINQVGELLVSLGYLKRLDE